MSQHSSATSRTPLGRIGIDARPVPLYPTDPEAAAIGDFHFAGGLVLSSRQSDLLHELSDIVVSGDRVLSVGDEGVLLSARLVLDANARLVGIADAALTRLLGENGRPLSGTGADAEGLAVLSTGDRLVSFEKHPRIWLYPEAGGRPRSVPHPRAQFPSNGGMEALAAQPNAGSDSYIVGGEESGETWTCRLSNGCAQGPTVDKPREFGLVSLNWLPDGSIAYLLRAYDPVRHNRITLKILRGTTLVARMDIAPPMTVDNFEGMTSVASPGGGRRFYLISDDNNRPSQRTLLFAFDWLPR